MVEDGKVLSNIISSQVFHEQYGGVVPELASRAHQKLIVPIIKQALGKADVEKGELDGVAATYGPGLIGSLLVGLNFGKAMAYGLGIPFVGVNHMEAHIFSNFLRDGSTKGKNTQPKFPFICLTVSGGHTQLIYVKKPFEYTMLGQTIDDAAGEAFDKVAKMLGLGYPGGPKIDKLAQEGDKTFVSFPRSYLSENSFDFSFSGLKTSVLYYLKKIGFSAKASSARTEDRQLLVNICASFQAAVVEVLVDKTIRAAEKYNVKDITIAGGVSANSSLRKDMGEEAAAKGFRLHIPKFEYCTDNGAMIAMVGWMKLKEYPYNSFDFELGPAPNLAL